MNYIIKSPLLLKSTIALPSSKSISNRALILNALSGCPQAIQNLSDCDDTEVLMKALDFENCNFDIKAAGTAMRFLTALLSTKKGSWTITGTERMKNRPIRLLAEALKNLGGNVEYMEKDGFPPLRIHGCQLLGGKISMSGNVSSQYISALLMIAPLMKEGLTLELKGNIISKPYIHLTIELMKVFGVDTDWNEHTIHIRPQTYKPVAFTIESDWSAASYWYEIAALSKTDIVLEGLFEKSLQGDSAVRRLFRPLGINTAFTPKGVVLSQANRETKMMEYNFEDEPDLAQTFVVTCCLLHIPFHFTGLQSLKIKETDRIEALKKELRKLGYQLKDSCNSILIWDGSRCQAETDPIISTYEDHRMAMAFAPTALLRQQGITIANPEVVSKSYPHYWEDLQKAGFTIEQQ